MHTSFTAFTRSRYFFALITVTAMLIAFTNVEYGPS